jgi:kelch-like protein 20
MKGTYVYLFLMFKVQTRLRLRCRPLAEDKFKPVIAENYYMNNHFWFELDHGQTGRLIALLKPLAIAPAISSKPLAIAPANSSKPLAIASQNTNLSQSLPWHDPSWKFKTFKIPESKSVEHHSTRSSMISGSDSDLLDECFKPLDTHSTDKEESAQNEKDLVWRKLKELAVARENQNLCWDNNVTDTPYADENWSDEKHSEEKEDNPSYPSEKEENFSHPSEKEENFSHPSEKEENSSSQFEHQFNIAQVVENVP